MLGVMILVLFGDGVVCQATLGSNPKVVPSPTGDWLSVNTAWGIGESRPVPAAPTVVVDLMTVCHRRSTRRVDLSRRIWWTHQPRRTSFTVVTYLREQRFFVLTAFIRCRTKPVQVTVCAALFRGFPWKRVPVYIFSQVLGAYLAALIVYADYFHAIDLVEGKGIRTVPGTAGLFTPYPVRFNPEELSVRLLINAFACCV